MAQGRDTMVPSFSAPPRVNAKTVHLKRGRHETPDRGACVMELASMLAGEPFSDHPKSVCPVLGSFLRTYNDGLGDAQRDELIPFAAMVVGSAAGRAERRWRADVLVAWAYPARSGLRRRLEGFLRPASWRAESVARVALGLDAARRRSEVDRLLRRLLHIAPEEPIGGRVRAPAAKVRERLAAVGPARHARPRDDRHDADPARS